MGNGNSGTPNNAPRSQTVQTGDPIKNLRSMIRSHDEKASQKNMSVKKEGWVLYSKIRTIEDFREQFDEGFVKEVEKESSVAQSGDPSVVEAIVYVSGITDFFPMPTGEGMKQLKDWQTTEEKEREKKFKDGQKKLIKDTIRLLDRFPRAFVIVDAAKAVSQLTKCQIMFPRKYDYSSGILLR